MKKIIFRGWKNNGYPTYALIDEDDFIELNKHRWHIYKHCHTFYARRLKDGKAVFMHREILGLTDPKIICDHEDQNGLNNQRGNLRIASSCQSNSNRRSFKTFTSQYKGVCWNKRRMKWRVSIGVNKKHTDIGFFDNEINAAIAYNKAAIEMHGKFVYLNKIA